MTRRQVTALLVLCLAVFMAAVDGTVISVAVPAITEQLHPSYNQILWIGDVYSFVLAGLLITMGNVGDRIGRKRLLLISSVAFGIASAAAAFAPTAGLLIVAGVQSVKREAILDIWDTGWAPRLVMLVTLVMTLSVPLQWAVLIGVVLFITAKVAAISFDAMSRAILPWLIPLLIVLAMVTVWPPLTLWLPHLLMGP